ncbi:DUF1648 domain-containing protein [Pseudobacillus badius]|uniref:DUF1648 domain-containing protein n=1 Tax=Bacillus badius TaxID=1455 RepID=UPI0007B04261|nr:DUF1648 domain-containing protein [Bacillus badius]KZN98602.1 hypothetical protein A4244_05650 [Bacillus badius]OCS83542.1 hypothetical protein A6M11_05655 [Bacillus badius]OVE53173.1 DUF1648 domain-containing protein [Bacillus badius]TDW05229.1 uncharacterized protein DUF1648 [Bacillus badius]UAT29791.1 DUF1648 domain-containing protein [Bacillus badius]
MNTDSQQEKRTFEKVSTFVSFAFIIINIIYLLVQWKELPGQVPIHFNAKGEADGWGGKGMVWFLPFIAFLLWGVMTALERMPHLYNIPNLTEENKEQLFMNTRAMLNVMKSEIIIFLVYTSWQSVQWSRGNEAGLGYFELPVFLIVVFGTMGVFLYRNYKISRKRV